MTGHSLQALELTTAKADVVIVGLVQQGAGIAVSATPPLPEKLNKRLTTAATAVGATGAVGEVTQLPQLKGFAARSILLVGLGKELSYDGLRRAAASAARSASKRRRVVVGLPTHQDSQLRAVVEGFCLGGYTYTRFKSKASEGAAEVPPGKRKVKFATPAGQPVAPGQLQTFTEMLDLTAAVAEVRDLVNAPPNVLNPVTFAEAIIKHVSETEKVADPAQATVSVEVWDEARLATERCGGMLGVGQASATPPRMVILRYQPAEATRHLALVGKGITFDSGGLTIKPSTGMTTMKCDMAGAATVMHAALAIAKRRLPIRVTAIAALAENMVSGNALRPGDVLTIRNGKTVEVTNTDAEGRLVLADALSYAVESQPDVLVDIATLTGHMVLALGDKIGGVMGADEVVQQISEVGAKAGETHWPMPIPPDIQERVKASKIADVLQHDWTRWGGGLYAAAFLQHFVGDVPWGHLDIAGPAFASAPDGHWLAGGTGFGLSTLVAYAEALSTADFPGQQRIQSSN